MSTVELVYVVDIDECSIMHGVCGDGVCRNTPGNFQCDCKEGYESSSIMQVCVGQYISFPSLTTGKSLKKLSGYKTILK